MALIPGQVREPAGNVTRASQQSGGAMTEAVGVVVRLAAATVAYTVGGTDYVDSLPALSVAQVWGGGGATAIDVTAGCYVTFIQPTLGSTATLFITPQDAWPALLDAMDVVPLDIVYRHQIRYYQPRRFGAKSMSGGATLGDLNSQSMSGGGTVG